MKAELYQTVEVLERLSAYKDWELFLSKFMKSVCSGDFAMENCHSLYHSFFEECVEKVKEYKTVIGYQEEELETINEELIRLKEENGHLDEVSYNLEKQIQELQVFLSEADTVASTLREEINFTKEEKIDMYTALENLEAENRELALQLEERKRNFQEPNEPYCIITVDQAKEIDDLVETVKKQNQELGKLVKEVEDLQIYKEKYDVLLQEAKSHEELVEENRKLQENLTYITEEYRKERTKGLKISNFYMLSGTEYRDSECGTKTARANGLIELEGFDQIEDKEVKHCPDQEAVKESRIKEEKEEEEEVRDIKEMDATSLDRSVVENECENIFEGMMSWEEGDFFRRPDSSGNIITPINNEEKADRVELVALNQSLKDVTNSAKICENRDSLFTDNNLKNEKTRDSIEMNNESPIESKRNSSESPLICENKENNISFQPIVFEEKQKGGSLCIIKERVGEEIASRKESLCQKEAEPNQIKQRKIQKREKVELPRLQVNQRQKNPRLSNVFPLIFPMLVALIVFLMFGSKEEIRILSI